MVALYGKRLYGASLYSADLTPESPIGAYAVSSVTLRARVRISGLFAIASQSFVTATGRLLWTPIPAAPCENTWTSLVRNPCCAVCNP